MFFWFSTATLRVHEEVDMTKIKVYPFTYYDAKEGVRIYGSGMRSEESINKMREKDKSKDHEIIWSKGIEVSESELTETGVYHAPENNENYK